MPLALRRLCKVFVLVLVAGVSMAVWAGTAEGETSLASWYGPGFEGLSTASGDVFDPYGYTAAHKTLPFGTPLTVSYEGASVGVVVTDRGPYVAGRELDLSQGAAEAIGLTRAGVDYVDYYHSGVSADQYASDQQYSGYESQYEDQYGPTVQDAPAGVAHRNSFGDYSVPEVATPVDTRTIEPQVAPPDDLAENLYVVRPGDTLSGISVQLGVSVDTLAHANGVADPDFILAGQILYY